MTKMLPLPDSVPGPGLFFWVEQWRWITKSIIALYSGHTEQLQKLSAIIENLEVLMTQNDDLIAAVAETKAAVQGLTAAVGPLTDAINSEKSDVQRLLTLLEQGPQPNPAVAQAIADLRSSNAELAATADALNAQATGLAGDDASVPPATPPTP